MDLLAVGQTVKYKYVEYTFDEKGEVESEKDVTEYSAVVRPLIRTSGTASP